MSIRGGFGIFYDHIGAGLANTYYWLDPKKKVTGVILTQILPFADQKTLQLLADFESAVYANGGKNGRA